MLHFIYILYIFYIYMYMYIQIKVIIKVLVYYLLNNSRAVLMYIIRKIPNYINYEMIRYLDKFYVIILLSK